MADLRFKIYGTSNEPLLVTISDDEGNAEHWLEQFGEWMRLGTLADLSTRSGEANVRVNFNHVWAVERYVPPRPARMVVH
jgi:hypothetical protein